MIVITIIITFIYSALIIAFIVGFNRIKIFKKNTPTTKNSFSICIPFRNEAKNLPELLDSLFLIDYPKEKFEIIFIDDDSTDDSIAIINNYLKQSLDSARPDMLIIKNIRKSNSPKKDALETAINKAKHPWIITTDADCVVPTKWLHTFDAFIQENNSKMICAPVTYQTKNNLLEQFQLLDFMSLIGTTIGSFGIKKPFLNNGANLCYSKKAFYKVNGYSGNNNISSGDDIFLLEKMTTQFPNKVHFLKSTNALVVTKPETSLKKLISQRIRWASKTTSYNNIFGKFVGVFVLLMNLLLITLFMLSFLKAIALKTLAMVFIVKFIVDFILILKTLKFTNQSKNVIFYPIIAIFYPFFSVFVVFLSFFKKRFNWKERMLN